MPVRGTTPATVPAVEREGSALRRVEPPALHFKWDSQSEPGMPVQRRTPATVTAVELQARRKGADSPLDLVREAESEAQLEIGIGFRNPNRFSAPL